MKVKYFEIESYEESVLIEEIIRKYRNSTFKINQKLPYIGIYGSSIIQLGKDAPLLDGGEVISVQFFLEIIKTKNYDK